MHLPVAAWSPMLLLGLLTLPNLANGHALVICNVGGPGTTKQAKPVLEKFLRHMERAGGLASGSMTGEYHSTRAGCLAYIKSQKPSFGVFDLSTFLNQRATLKLKPLACMGKMKSVRYHLLVREGSYKNLDDLKGKTLISSHLQDLPFVSRIIFSNKLDAARHFKVNKASRPLKGIRKVARGKADATLVDQVAYKHLGELKLPSKLVSIYASPELPGLTLAVLNNGADAKDAVKKVIKALPKLCTGEGKKMCRTFNISAFNKVKANAYRALIKQYGR